MAFATSATALYLSQDLKPTSAINVIDGSIILIVRKSIFLYQISQKLEKEKLLPPIA
jgi:hypothetical protein